MDVRLSILAGVIVIPFSLHGTGVEAALSATEASKLGIEETPLTPMGAIRAANDAGTIPQWTPNAPPLPTGYEKGGRYANVYDNGRKRVAVSAFFDEWPVSYV
jgi:hypothetical protein